MPPEISRNPAVFKSFDRSLVFLGTFRPFSVKLGNHLTPLAPGPSLHLERQGTQMIVNPTRLPALETGLLEPTGTVERLAALDIMRAR